jgi:hypothetical protein
MKKKIVLEGSIDERFKTVEKTLNHMRPRISKKIIGFVPPTMIPIFIPEPTDEGYILSYPIPIGGRVVKAAMAVQDYRDSKAVEFACGIESGGVQSVKKFKTRKELGVVDIGVDVSAGDQIIFKVLTPASDKGPAVKNIWVTLLFEVGVGHAAQEQFLIDALLEDYE